MLDRRSGIVSYDSRRGEPQAPRLLPNQRGAVLIRLRFPSRLTEGSGSRPAVLAVRDQDHVERLIEFYLNGP
ncbi:MAG: hypothetical protein ACK56I_16530 [bacterium]